MPVAANGVKHYALVAINDNNYTLDTSLSEVVACEISEKVVLTSDSPSSWQPEVRSRDVSKLQGERSLGGCEYRLHLRVGCTWLQFVVPESVKCICSATYCKDRPTSQWAGKLCLCSRYRSQDLEIPLDQGQTSKLSTLAI